MKINSLQYKRRFVIPDIHGCFKTFDKLLNKIDLKKNDAIFVLGDMISRGPDSKAVLDTILNIKQKGYNIFVIRGNHEQRILNISNTKNDYAKKLETLKDIFSKEGLLLPKYKEMFESMPFYIELEDFLLVHAGFDFSKDNIYSNLEAMLNIRFWEPNIIKTHGKRIIHGHQPTFKNYIKEAVRHKNNRIPLDNGCVYALSKEYKYRKIGSLCCLELNSMKLTFQKNVDK